MSHVVFMMASSVTPIRPFVELTRQLECEADIQVVILCEPDIGYKRVLQESGVDTEGITFVELGTGEVEAEKKEVAVGERQRAPEGERKEIALFRSRFPFFYRMISPVYRVMLLAVKTIAGIRKLKKEKKELERIFKQYDPKCLILYSDARGGYEAVSIRIAEEREIPRIVAPIVYLLPAEQLLKGPKNGYRVRHGEKMPFLCRRVMEMYPDIWVDTAEETVFYYPPDMIFSLDFMKMLPQNPWIVGAGNSSMIAMMFQENYEHCLDVMGEEFVRKRVVLTRSIEKTRIRMQFSQRELISAGLREKYNLKKERIVLFALSAYSESTLSITYEKTVDNYNKILKALSETFEEVLISLHPRMKREAYAVFENIGGCRIVEEPLYSIIVACDVYVGCEISSAKNLIEDFNFHKILIPHETFLRGLDEGQIYRLRLELREIREKQDWDVIMKEDHKDDFYKIVLEKMLL